MDLVTKEQLHDQEHAIEECRKRVALGFLGVGKALYVIHKNDLWQFSEANSFDEYCEKVQGMKKSWAYALVGVYAKLSDILLKDEGLKQIDVTRCVRLLPHITEENREELLHMAVSTTAKDFDYNISNMKGHIAPDQCNHPEWTLINFKQCTTCKLRVRVEE